MGFMIGCSVGIGLAVGLHVLFSAMPELANGPLGRVAAWLARPGARAITSLTGHAGSHELGILATWLSFQLSCVAGGGLVGGFAGLLARDRKSEEQVDPTKG